MAATLTLTSPPPAAGEAGPARPAIPSHRLAMLIFLTAETMLFTGLLGGYLVLRYSVPMWPPAGQPLLPLWAGGANLALLTVASVGIHLALRSARRAGGPRVARGIALSLAAGTAFLWVLGVEWSHLHAQGLSLSTGGTYGALFYTLTGCHALHVMAVWIWSAALLPAALRDRYYPARHHPVEMAGMFWHFVTLAWMILFVILYL
jgi:cytochrome c oxidase subunit 3